MYKLNYINVLQNAVIIKKKLVNLTCINFCPLIGNEIRKLPVEMTRTYRTITGMTPYVT